MSIHDVKKYISDLTSHVLFDFNGKQCGVDPLSQNEFDVWYGDKIETVQSVDAVFSTPMFDGKSLTEIFNDIENLDY